MRAVVQRVKRAQVTVAGEIVGEIGPGLLVLLGVAHDDTADDVAWMAGKLTGLRIFEDDAGKMNLGLTDVRGSMLVVSQFTLLGDCQKGRRPSFIQAARPEVARPLYQQFVAAVGQLGSPTATGIFQAEMQVELVNDGPVTLVVESRPVGG
ncbi:MAG: D-aminoacyl-tRNA deacylase [Planctomycetaceae bacterium]